VSDARTAHLLAQNIAAAAAVAGRLSESRDDLGPRFPLDGMAIDRLGRVERREVDGLLKQVENLQDILGGRVFRGILLAGGEDVAGLTPRDIANRMEALGVVADAADWRRLNDLRNRLSHDYPLDRERQTRLLNDAFAAIAPLLETLARVEAYVRTRLPEVAVLLAAHFADRPAKRTMP
jgi:hypothetical protein